MLNREKGLNMLKNLVFDFGNVLVRFEPFHMLRTHVESDAEAEKLFHLIYESADWINGDLGYLTRPEVVERLCANHPDKAELLKRVMPECPSILVMPDGTPQLLEDLKKAGFACYFISNVNPEDFHYMRGKYPAMGVLEGIASFQEHIRKPDAAIYQTLLERYGLKAEESIFVDDMPVNTAAAEALGFRSITLTGGADTLEEALMAVPEIAEAMARLKGN